MKINRPSDPWLVNTLEEIELAQLHRNAARPFRENLIWLEETGRLVSKFSNPFLKVKREGWKSEEAIARMMASFEGYDAQNPYFKTK